MMMTTLTRFKGVISGNDFRSWTEKLTCSLRSSSREYCKTRPLFPGSEMSGNRQGDCQSRTLEPPVEMLDRAARFPLELACPAKAIEVEKWKHRKRGFRHE